MLQHLMSLRGFLVTCLRALYTSCLINISYPTQNKAVQVIIYKVYCGISTVIAHTQAVHFALSVMFSALCPLSQPTPSSPF
jgi:hypothetical protein